MRLSGDVLKDPTPRDHVEFLLSDAYRNSTLDPEHQADLDKSGITAETRELHRLRSVPPQMIDLILGFRSPRVRSAYLIPFPDPRGGWFDHVKLKVFSADGAGDVRGDHVEQYRERYRYSNGARKYLVRRASSPRVFFCLHELSAALEGDTPLWCVEGPKKALAVAQLGLPAIGIESAWGWHEKGSRELLPDFDLIALHGRTVKVVPDSDVSTNPDIMRSMRQLGDALRAVGAHPRLVRLPQEIPA
jgi:hypothetical protein